ncbi:hypothetical protein IIA15_00245 [candidate division TA06 bacterium]|nr:hypothetical protein [candidate division TA06 bacterium]
MSRHRKRNETDFHPISAEELLAQPEEPTRVNGEAIRALLGHYADVLTEWEEKFLKSIKDQDPLTPKQEAKLNEIWQEVVEQRRRE